MSLDPGYGTSQQAMYREYEEEEAEAERERQNNSERYVSHSNNPKKYDNIVVGFVGLVIIGMVLGVIFLFFG